MLPDTIDELEAVRKECVRMSNRKAILSATASIVPVPFTDVATDVLLLKRIIPRISERFGLSKEQIDEYNPQLAIFIYDAAKRLGTKMVGRYVTKELIMQILKKVGIKMTARQATKYIPVLGQVLAASVSFAAMRFIIRSHINECYRVTRSVIEAHSLPGSP